MLKIITLTLGQLETNCYIAFCSQTLNCIIIDPADEGGLISQKILEEKLHPTAIVMTHGHFDHVLGVLEIKLNFDIPVLINQKDNKLYTLANQSAAHWLKIETLKVPSPDQFIKESDTINVGREQLTIIETPGHTPGSICLYSEKNDVIFTGDTLFKDGVGRTDFSYSKPLQLTKSLKKLTKLPDNTVIYPGHGESSYLKYTADPFSS